MQYSITEYQLLMGTASKTCYMFTPT